MSMSEPHYVEPQPNRLLGSVGVIAMAIPAVFVSLLVLPLVISADKRFVRNTDGARERDARRHQELARQREAKQEGQRIARHEAIGEYFRQQKAFSPSPWS